MKCPSCGNENLANKKFCGLCGQSLMAQAAPGGYPGASTAPTPPPPMYGDQQPYQQPPQYSSQPPGPYPGEQMVINVEAKYKTLRVIAVCFKILAFVLAVAGLIGSIGMVVVAANARYSEQAIVGILSAVGGLIASGLVFLLYYGAAQMIRLLIDLEENTRITNLLLERRR